MQKMITYLLVAFIVSLGLDGISKIWALQALELYQPVPVMGEVFRFTLGYNTGVAFGLFANTGLWPLIVTGIVIVGLSYWFTRSLLVGDFPPLAAIPIGLLLGGAVGNFVDRLLDLRVVDFLDVGIGTMRWPTFNLADTFIMVGLGILIVMTAATPEPQPNSLDEPLP